MQQPSIFTKIIDGEIPCHKIYEDEHTFAFLDIMPATRGHALVVPKRQVEFIWDLDDDEYAALMATVKKVGLRIRDVLRPAYVGQLVVGTDVPHAHVHVIPFAESREIQGALGSDRVRVDDATLDEIAGRLRF